MTRPSAQWRRFPVHGSRRMDAAKSPSRVTTHYSLDPRASVSYEALDTVLTVTRGAGAESSMKTPKAGYHEAMYADVLRAVEQKPEFCNKSHYGARRSARSQTSCASTCRRLPESSRGSACAAASSTTATSPRPSSVSPKTAQCSSDLRCAAPPPARPRPPRVHVPIRVRQAMSRQCTNRRCAAASPASPTLTAIAA